MQRDEPKFLDCIYLTKEQSARISALAIDSLVGTQIRSDANDQTYCLVDMVPIDDTNNSRHFVVYADGSYTETT